MPSWMMFSKDHTLGPVSYSNVTVWKDVVLWKVCLKLGTAEHSAECRMRRLLFSFNCAPVHLRDASQCASNIGFSSFVCRSFGFVSSDLSTCLLPPCVVQKSKNTRTVFSVQLKALKSTAVNNEKRESSLYCPVISAAQSLKGMHTSTWKAYMYKKEHQ